MEYTDNKETRQEIIDGCLWMNSIGLNQGTSGNISVRVGDEVLITPSGVAYDRMTTDMIVRMPLVGDPVTKGLQRPSTEWRFHQSLLQANPQMSAVVHAHPAHCTALAVQGRPIPACHYMIAAFGGADVRLAEYALFGSAELSELIVTAMKDRSGCLMANHGAITSGETLARALWRMQELENLAQVYLLALATGTPQILDDAQMQDVIHAFADYGLKA